ncbi:MAG: DNA alkylation repair protein [Clostridiaceae bacterium]
MWYDNLIKEIVEAKNPTEAKAMEAYMKNNFIFLGVKKPIREAIMTPYFKEQSKTKKIDWDFIQVMYTKKEREFQYLALDYLHKMKKYINPKDLPKIETLITTHSWWETVDSAADLIYAAVSKDPNQKDIILTMSKNENMWLRRTSILYQRKAKKDTNKEILEKTILNNLGTTEFFINKAIGWALREYAKTESEWVLAFTEKHKNSLSPLSLREALKHFK